MTMVTVAQLTLRADFDCSAVTNPIGVPINAENDRMRTTPAATRPADALRRTGRCCAWTLLGLICFLGQGCVHTSHHSIYRSWIDFATYGEWAWTTEEEDHLPYDCERVAHLHWMYGVPYDLDGYSPKFWKWGQEVVTEGATVGEPVQSDIVLPEPAPAAAPVPTESTHLDNDPLPAPDLPRFQGEQNTSPRYPGPTAEQPRRVEQTAYREVRSAPAKKADRGALPAWLFARP